MPAILGLLLSASFLSVPSPSPAACIDANLVARPTTGWLGSVPASLRYTTSPRNTRRHAFPDDVSSSLLDQEEFRRQSRISCIRSFNLASVVNADDPTGIVCLSMNGGLKENPTLVAVTGETGTGKSLLVARALELLNGGKAPASLVSATSHGDNSDMVAEYAPSAFVEMELLLCGPHLAGATASLERIGIDPDVLFRHNNADSLQGSGTLILKRTLILQQQRSAASKARLKSICEINGRVVTLKSMAALASPLFAVVDASTAAMALAKGDSRMAVIDTAVSAAALAQVAAARNLYRQSRQTRESMQDELASRTLPQGFIISGDSGNEKDLELLSHWIDELDVFEGRVVRFCDLLASDGFLPNESSSLATTIQELIATKWLDNSSAKGQGFSSSLYTKLNDLRGALMRLDDQLVAARNSYEALASLSEAESALTAVERARNLLFDAAGPQDASSSGRLFDAAEHSHELLNAAESALAECARFLEDDDRGLIQTLEAARSACPISVEEVEAILLDWNSLARKHGIASHSLPSCHKALHSERDGNVEARTLLPKAIATEERALKDFSSACAGLTEERVAIAETLSRSVTERMPSLGMEQSAFRVDFQQARSCTDYSTYASGSTLGVDSVDFLLLHGKSTDRRGGSVHEVASSGEKARILLAVECTLPGSVGASCGGSGSPVYNTGSDDTDNSLSKIPPIAVLYDEIDAHVGGRAAVSLANMLVDQSRSCQVVAITHSPSVAAAADLHIVIQKVCADQNSEFKRQSQNWVRACAMVGSERLTELARMASGDLAVPEAQVFAEALIRDGAKRRESQV